MVVPCRTTRSRAPLIRKREPEETPASELIESQQGFSIAIPVLQVQREIHIRKLLPEFEFIGIFAFIAKYRRFHIQLMVPVGFLPRESS